MGVPGWPVLDAEGSSTAVGGPGSWDFGERWVDFLDAGEYGVGRARRWLESPCRATAGGRGRWTRAGVAGAMAGVELVSLYCAGCSARAPGWVWYGARCVAGEGEHAPT